MSVRNPVIVDYGAELMFPLLYVGNQDACIEAIYTGEDIDLSKNPDFCFCEYGNGRIELIARVSELRTIIRVVEDSSVIASSTTSMPTSWRGVKQHLLAKVPRQGKLWINGVSGSDLSDFADHEWYILPQIYTRANHKGRFIVEKLNIYIGSSEPDPACLVFSLQWDGIGLPWNAVNSERGTLVSGSIRPLYPVVRTEGSYCPGYKLSNGASIVFDDLPAGTLRITKRVNGIITTEETSFAGGTLTLTDEDILDVEIVG